MSQPSNLAKIQAACIFASSRDAYIFNVTLVGSSSPAITRVLEVPMSYTFQNFHHAIQYAMGWKNSHLHEFQFYSKVQRSFNHTGTSFAFNDKVLEFRPESLFEDCDEHLWDSYYEHDYTLEDVYSSSGKFARKIKGDDGREATLLYTYDLGDCWGHELTYIGSKPASSMMPVIHAASGRCPLEDSHGVYGWKDVKDAFLTPSNGRTKEQSETIDWCFGQDIDFDPFKEPSVFILNESQKWDAYLMAVKKYDTA